MSKRRIRAIIVYTVMITVLTLIQFSLPDSASFQGIKPDLLFVFTILTGYLYGTGDVVVIGLITGFLCDSFSGRFLGLGMLLFLYCGIISSVFLKRILSRNLLLAMVQVIFGTLIFYVSLTAISLLFFSVSQPVSEYLFFMMRYRLFPALPVNLAISVVLYLLLKKFSVYKSDSLSLEDESLSAGDSLWE